MLGITIAGDIALTAVMGAARRHLRDRLSDGLAFSSEPSRHEWEPIAATS
jgi:hypothetical protein